MLKEFYPSPDTSLWGGVQNTTKGKRDLKDSRQALLHIEVTG